MYVYITLSHKVRSARNATCLRTGIIGGVATTLWQARSLILYCTCFKKLEVVLGSPAWLKLSSGQTLNELRR